MPAVASTSPSMLTTVGPVFVALLGAAVALFSLWWQKRQERRNVSRAVLAEASRLLSILPRHLTWWETCQASQDTDLPLIPFSTDVYDKLSDRVGHLNTTYIAAIVDFYGHVKFLNSIQATRGYYAEKNRMDEFAEFYSSQLAAVPHTFGPLLEDAFSHYEVLPPGKQPHVVPSNFTVP